MTSDHTQRKHADPQTLAALSFTQWHFIFTVLPASAASALLRYLPLADIEYLLSCYTNDGNASKAAAISRHLGLNEPPTESYTTRGTWSHVKSRCGWLVLLALLGIVSGLIIASYEEMLSQLILLAIYMPVIASAGGNAGTQSATLVIRAMAKGELGHHASVQIIKKELPIALILGTILAAVISFRVLFLAGSSDTGEFDLSLVALAIATALFIQVSLSGTLGALLPVFACKLKLDPAVLVSPVLASIVDISGIWIYFATVNYMLGLS